MSVTLSDVNVGAFYAAFEKDVFTFERVLPEMLPRFHGEFVAICNGEVIGHDKDWNALIKMTQDRYPEEFVFVEKLMPPKDSSVEMDCIEI